MLTGICSEKTVLYQTIDEPKASSETAQNRIKRIAYGTLLTLPGLASTIYGFTMMKPYNGQNDPQRTKTLAGTFILGFGMVYTVIIVTCTYSRGARQCGGEMVRESLGIGV